LDTRIEYIVSDHSVYTEGETFPVWDCIANIVYQLTAMQVFYGQDYQIAESYINKAGQRVMVLDFKSPETAMIVKLHGIKKVNK
jgi:hypothetical protein